jgi:pimeloyl-ACP methyl ester carboxylesterase
MTATSQPPIVLLHGWGGSFESTWAANGWLDAIRAMGRTVVPIDLPGHGPAGGSTDPEDYSMLVEAVGRKIPEDIAIDAIGFSLGAKLVLALAARDLNRYRRIVVAGLGGNAFAPERLGDVVANALESGLTESTPAPVRRLVDYALSAGNDPRCVAAVLRRPPNPVITPTRLMWLRLPTLVIAGDQDAIAMPLEPLLEALPHASRRVLPGVDHLSLPSRKEFRDAALAFLS